MKTFLKLKGLNIFAIFFLSIFSITDLDAAPGDLDLTFGSGGKTSTTVGLSREDVRDIVLLNDGKILAGGTVSGDSGNPHLVLARYNADSSPDLTFGTNGVVVSAVPSFGGAKRIGVQSDGKIVVSGYRLPAYGVFTEIPVLVRFNADGSVDSGFGTNGVIDTNFSGVNDLLIQPDDKIVLSGSSQQSSTTIFAVMRYNANGTADASFGISGLARTTIGSGNAWIESATIQTDGKIVVAGYGSNGADYDFAVVRFNTDGTLDGSFDGDGKLLYPVGAGDDQAEIIKVQADGKILVAGSVAVSAPDGGDFGVVRFNSNGSPDTTFNGTGKVVIAVTNTFDRAYDLDLQNDGKILVSGASLPDYSAARLNSDGSLDTTFDGDGKVVLSNPGLYIVNFAGTVIQPDGRIFISGTVQNQLFHADHRIFQLNSVGTILSSRTEDFYKGDDFGRDVAVQADGKIVVAGYSSGGSNSVSLARFNPNGSIDTTFGSSGKILITDVREQRANGVVIQPDGKIVVVGTTIGNTAFTSLAVWRFNADGSFDTTFDTDGKAVIDAGGLSEGFDVVLQPDGKIVIAGRISVGASAIGVFRVNANGSPDTTFNGVGYRMVSTGGASTAYGNSVALQSDGKIVVGGNYEGCCSGLWVRLNSNGTIDGTLMSASTYIEDVAIQADGKIVFAGGLNGNLSVTRYNTDKTIDTSFGNNGVNFAVFGSGESRGQAIAIQPSGRIVVGGYAVGTNKDFALARFNSNGFLDVEFGNGGKIVTQFGAGEDQINGLALQSDGKIIAGGYYNTNTDFDFAVARYDGSGTNTIANRTSFDFDGDGRADIVVYRPSNNVWYQLLGTTYQYSSFTFGAADDVLAPADYDGDGKTDLGIFRPSTGAWWYRSSAQGNAFRAVQWGQSGDIPLPSDVDGDGKADHVVYRPSNSTWYRLTSSGQATSFVFGSAGDKPLIGDFDGDGKADYAVFRPSTGVWWFTYSSQNDATRAIQFGAAEDVPAPADYDGDGKTDLGVFRPSTGGWYILNSGNNSVTIVGFGLSGDKPITGDYDGDGKADIAVYRPSNGVWYLYRSSAGYTGIQLGTSTDLPIPNAFIRQ